MTFSEAVQAMLDGKNVTRANSTGHSYIMINDVGDVVDNTGKPFNFSERDFIGDWKLRCNEEDTIAGMWLDGYEIDNKKLI